MRFSKDLVKVLRKIYFLKDDYKGNSLLYFFCFYILATLISRLTSPCEWCLDFTKIELITNPVLTGLVKVPIIGTKMEAISIVVFGVLGAIVGSFLNVCIDRLPTGESLLFPASHCSFCHHRLSVKDLSPVFSYLWLRGRCRYCKAPIPRRLVWVEIGTGVLFAFLYWHYSLTGVLAVAAFYCCVFITLMVIDLERGLILNKIVYPVALVALVISVFLPPSRLIFSSEDSFLFINAFLPRLGIVQAAIGGGVGLGLFMLVVVVSRGGMGWGDVKMAGLIGLVTGFPLVFVALLLSVIFGGLVAGILLLFKVKKRKGSIPFGPFLSLAAMFTLLWGNNVVNWYLGLFGAALIS